MIFINTKQDLASYRNMWQLGQVGLVPTMGNLHQGHLSLIEKSLQENDLTLITIFVNPKQFGPLEDLDKYPRTLDQDKILIQKIKNYYPHKTLVLFAPKSTDEIYPEKFAGHIEIESEIAHILCALSRPHHFRGVTTVVALLFQLCRPHRAYFGKKDYQQFKIIEKMCVDFHFNIKIIPCPIIRENNLLALSSRNQYLTETEKDLAYKFAEYLLILSNQLQTNGQHLHRLNPPAIEGIQWEYLEIRNADDLGPSRQQGKHFVLLAACKIGLTRLIDNREFSVT